MMGKAARRRNRESRNVLREIGVVVFEDLDGNEVVIGGTEGADIREWMKAQCPICTGEDHHH